MAHDGEKVVRFEYAKYGIPRSRRPLKWMGSSHEALISFSEDAQDRLGDALRVAQEGGRHADARPMRGNLREVTEIVAPCADGTYRLMYVTQISEVIHVLHAFKKKAHHGVETPRKEIRLIRTRLKQAKEAAG